MNGLRCVLNTLASLATLVSSKSNILPDLCVEKVMYWYRLSASQVSVKIVASASSSLLICKLKSPVIMLLLYSVSVMVIKSIKSSMNILLVILFSLLHGGW